MHIWKWTCFCACLSLWKILQAFFCAEMASAGSSYSHWWLGWLTDHICFQSKEKQSRSNPKPTGTRWLSLNDIIPLCFVCVCEGHAHVFQPCVLFSSVFKGVRSEPLKLPPRSWYQNRLWLLSSMERVCVTLIETIGVCELFCVYELSGMGPLHELWLVVSDAKQRNPHTYRATQSALWPRSFKVCCL